VRNLDSLAARELLERIGEVIGSRHRRAVNQHRDDWDVALKRRTDLDTDKIGGIIQAAAIVIIRAREPLPADDGDERIASANAFGQDLNEIATRRDVVDVDEDAFAPEAGFQTIVDSPREACGVLPAITDEDAAPHAMPP
jgi:hypothetical protein